MVYAKKQVFTQAFFTTPRYLLKRYRGNMSDEVVKIIECPRDAWQGLPKQIPSEVKADYLQALVNAGFKHLDAVSFVSPAAVPQMADSELVLEFLDPPDDVEIIAIVVNRKGAERAVETAAVRTIGFPYSLSPEFLKRNQKQSPEEALDALETVGEIAYKAGLDLVAYVSMAFGNPYGDPWTWEETVSACDLLAALGLKQISLADTVGLAAPEQISSLVGEVIRQTDGVEIGVHLHARPGEQAQKIAAAYHAGCRRFDMAIGGLGGCPFAQDTLVGNIDTEAALAELAGLHARLPPLRSRSGLLAMSRAIAERFGQAKQ
jgi:hydroxymethylglutaryl-CoA lyase